MALWTPFLGISCILLHLNLVFIASLFFLSSGWVVWILLPGFRIPVETFLPLRPIPIQLPRQSSSTHCSRCPAARAFCSGLIGGGGQGYRFPFLSSHFPSAHPNPTPASFHFPTPVSQCQEQLVSNKINFRTIRHQRGTTGTTMGSNSRALKKVHPSRELYLRSVLSFLANKKTKKKHERTHPTPGTGLLCWPFVQWSMAKRLLDRPTQEQSQHFQHVLIFHSTPWNNRPHPYLPTYTHIHTYRDTHTHTHTGSRHPLRTKAIARTWTWRVWSLALQGINLKKSHQSQSQEEDNARKKWRWCPGKLVGEMHWKKG